MEADMSDILVRCPLTLEAVSTGLKSEWVVLHSLPAVPIPIRCTACGQMHRWRPEDAWIGHHHVKSPEEIGIISS
jgi:hypothetical protein